MRLKTLFIGLIICLFLISCVNNANVDHEHVGEKEKVSKEDLSEIQALEEKVLRELDFGKCKIENLKDSGTIEICNYEKDFKNENELKRTFPNLEAFNVIDGFEFNKISIRLDETSNKRFKKITKWSEFNRFSFELIKDKTNVINLTYAPKEFMVEKPLEIKEYNFKDSNYKIIYNPDVQGYEGIMIDTLINNKKYYIAFNNYNSKTDKIFLNEKNFISLIDKNFK